MEKEELLPQEEETSIITLTDENGENADFEYLDCIPYQGKEYLVLIPAEEESSEIVILEIRPVDEDNETYCAVQDEENPEERAARARGHLTRKREEHDEEDSG